MDKCYEGKEQNTLRKNHTRPRLDCGANLNVEKEPARQREWEGRSQRRAQDKQRPQGRKEIGVFEELKERRNGRRYRGREARL